MRGADFTNEPREVIPVDTPKLLCDLVKMTAFQIETMLVAAVGPHLRRAPHEGRAFIADVMQLDARLEPREERLDVVLAKASAPRYTQV